ncbi:MAG: hypothetical protein JEY97_15865 [Bacteroidales bacterium]|nr:hypothetical protein [Bacteroidales bacterium]
MNSNSILSKVALIYGIIITSLMLLIFGTKLIGSIIENGFEELKEIANALIHWHDNPTAFFFIYIIGYAIVWWKSFWGSVIIIAGSLLVFFINIENMGFLIFSISTFVVGLLYVSTWFDLRKRNKT